MRNYNRQPSSFLLTLGRTEENFWHHSKREMLDRLLSNCYRDRANPGQLLDLGCGMGDKLDFLRLLLPNTKTVGLDINFAALRLCKQNYSGDWCQGEAGKLPFGSEKFDLLICLDVIEHQQDDIAVLEECHRVCKAKGTLIVSVPACKWLWSGFDDLVAHKRRYNKDELENKLKQARFKIKRITYTFFTILPLFFLVRGIQKIFFSSASRNKETIKKLAEPVTVIDSLMYFFLKPEIILLGRFNFPIGSSLICIAEKPA